MLRSKRILAGFLIGILLSISIPLVAYADYLILGASPQKSDFSLIPFANIYHFYINDSAILMKIFHFSFPAIVAAFILGLLAALLYANMKQQIKFIVIALIIETAGFTQIYLGYSVYKAYDTSILLAQIMVFAGGSALVKLLKKDEKVGSDA